MKNLQVKKTAYALPRGTATTPVEALPTPEEVIDLSAVHQTGDETIAGTKTFTVTLRAQGGVRFADGTVQTTAAASGYDGADAVKLTGNQNIAGTKTFAAKVGIGTLAPRTTLDITESGINQGSVGAFVVTGADVYGQVLTLQAPVASYSGSLMTSYKANGNSGAAMGVGVKFSGDFPEYFHVMNPSGASVFVVRPSGNVGIGTNNPQQTLSIQGGIGFSNQGSDKKLHSPADGMLAWRTNATNAFRCFVVEDTQGTDLVRLSINGDSFLNGGKVGIGTRTPLHKLDIVGESGGGTRVGAHIQNLDATGYNELVFDNDVTEPHTAGAFVFGYGGTGTANPNEAYFYNRRNGRIFFGTSNAVRLTIHANGNVGVGAENPQSKLEVAGTVHSSTGGFKFPDGTVQTTAAAGTVGAVSVAQPAGNNLTFNLNAEYAPVSAGTFTVDTSTKVVGAVVVVYLTPSASDPTPNLPASQFQTKSQYTPGKNLEYVFKVGRNGFIQYTINVLD
jgi:hypothetical protein